MPSSRSSRRKTMGYSPDFPHHKVGVERMSIQMQKAVLADARKRLQAEHDKKLAEMKRSLDKVVAKQRQEWHSDIAKRLEAIRSQVKKSKKSGKKVRFRTPKKVRFA